MFHRLDQLLTTITRRPGPAIAALCVGILVGFTMAAAFGGSDTPSRASHPSASRSKDVPTATPRSPNQSKPKKPSPQGTQTVPAPPAPSGDLQAAADAAASAAHGQGHVGVAALKLDGGQVYIAGEDRTFEAWSTSKIPVIALYLTAHPQPDAAATGHIDRAIRQSSNVDVRALYGQIVHEHGVRGANAMLRDLIARNGGQFEGLQDRRDPSIGNSVPFGNARWSPATAAKFFQRLADGCVLANNPSGAKLMLTYMNSLTEGDWGAPQVFPRDRVFAKSGWTDTGTTVSQVAIIGRGHDAYVVAIMTEPGNYPRGQQLIASMFRSFKAVAGTPEAGQPGSLPHACGAAPAPATGGGTGND
jgi:hypothetical protein